MVEHTNGCDTGAEQAMAANLDSAESDLSQTRGTCGKGDDKY